MATLGSKRIHIVFADSRGCGLQKKIDRLNTTGEYMEIDDRKGATLADLIEIDEAYLPKHPFDVLYIAGGINDITFKNKLTNQISYEWGNGPGLGDHLTSTVMKADAALKMIFPASKVIFCPLIGSELS